VETWRDYIAINFKDFEGLEQSLAGYNHLLLSYDVQLFVYALGFSPQAQESDFSVIAFVLVSSPHVWKLWRSPPSILSFCWFQPCPTRDSGAKK